MTADTVQVGISWLDATGTSTMINTATGSDRDTSQGEGNLRRYADAVVKYLNARGGIAGRAIEPIYYEIAAADTLTIEARRRSEEEMCATFTEDNQVFAMIPFLAAEGIISECAKRTDTVYLAVNQFEEGVDDQRFAEVGHWWYGPSRLTADRREQVMADRLLAQGFFSQDAKVGLMIAGDLPVYKRAVDRVFKPALARAGVEIVDEVVYPDRFQSPWDNYVLQFQSSGVTHVVFSACSCGGAAAGLFMRAAENQRWRPVYGLATDSQLAGVTSYAPPEQMTTVSGIVWTRLPEDNEFEDRRQPITSAHAECRRIVEDSGLPDVDAAGPYCEGLFFLKAGLDRAAALTADGFAAAVEALGDSYVPVTTWSTSFGPGRHDGVAGVRDMAWDADCQCYVYTSSLHPTR